jgi:hypothetical protein
MTTDQMSARDQIIYELARTKKTDLVLMAKAVAPARGDHWIIGGPDDWSKDELIAYLAPPRS